MFIFVPTKMSGNDFLFLRNYTTLGIQLAFNQFFWKPSFWWVTLPETNSSHLKMDVRVKRSFRFRVKRAALFSGAKLALRFREGVFFPSKFQVKQNQALAHLS